MKVYASVFVLCCIAVLLTSEPYCCSPHHQDATAAQGQGAPPPIGAKQNNSKPGEEAQATDQGSPWLCTALKRPDWWLVIIAALTGFAIAYQAREMARATGVMQSQWTTMQGQLAQMESAGKQTDKIIEHASKQVIAAEGQVELMKTAGTHTEQLAQQAVKQSDLTQRQFDLTNRPWISIDFVKPISNLEFREGGDVLVWFAYQIQNVGNSVAQHISPWIEPIITAVDNPVEVRARISEQLKKPIDSYFDHGKLIFPDQVITDRYPVMIRPDKLVQALEKSPFKDRDGSVIKAIGLEIFVCFDYQSTVDPSKHHQTQSMYLLGYAGNGMFLPSQKSYGMNGLGLVFKGFGAYAD
jgi:hypothetical protein